MSDLYGKWFTRMICVPIVFSTTVIMNKMWYIMRHWHHYCYRGTAAIGPIITALKDGKTVTYEGKEVNYYDVHDSLTAYGFYSISRFHSIQLFLSSIVDNLASHINSLFTSVPPFRSSQRRCALLLILAQSSWWWTVLQRSLCSPSAATSSCKGKVSNTRTH